MWVSTWRSVQRSLPLPHPSTKSATGSSRPRRPALPELQDRHGGERLARGVPEHHVVGAAGRGPGRDSPIATSSSTSPREGDVALRAIVEVLGALSFQDRPNVRAINVTWVKFEQHDAESYERRAALKFNGAPMPQTATSVQAGWRPDPSGRFEWRYWDGGWTNRVANTSTSGAPPVDPTPSPAPSAGATPTTAPGGDGGDARTASVQTDPAPVPMPPSATLPARPR